MSSLSDFIYSLKRLDKILPLEDLFSKGACLIQAESEEDMKNKARSFKRLGLKVSTEIDTGGGPYRTCVPNEYKIYVSLN